MISWPCGDVDRDNLWHGGRDQAVQLNDELVMFLLRNPDHPLLASDIPVRHAN